MKILKLLFGYFSILSFLFCVSEPIESKILNEIETRQVSKKNLIPNMLQDDEFEDNDSFDTAYDLDGLSNHYLAYREIEIEANLNFSSSQNDIDFYTFDIIRKSEVTINLSANNSNLSYTFAIYNAQISEHEDGETLSTQNSIIYNDNSNIQEKNFMEVLLPGTYYLKLAFCTDELSSNNIEYCINISISKCSDYDNESISDLKYNKNLKGAVWINDLYPFETIGFSTPFETYRFTLNGSSNLNYFDDIYNLDSDRIIKMAEIYVWDPSIKEILFTIVDKLDDELELYFKIENYVSTIVDLTLELLDEHFELAITIGEKISRILFNEELSEILTNILIEEGEYNLLNIELPDNLLDAKKIGEYIAMLKDALLNNDDNYICKIPIYCQIAKYTHLLLNTEYYLDFDCTYKNVFNEVYSIDLNNSNNIISSTPENPIYSSGKIYSLEFTDIKINKNNLVETSVFYDVMPTNINQVYLNSPISFDINFGHYNWYKFVAPETNKYHFIACGLNGNDLAMSLFSDPALGYYDDTGRYAYRTGGYHNMYDASNKGVYIPYDLYAGDIVYIKLNHKDFSQTMSNLVFYITDSEPTYLIHEHFYNSYTRVNTLRHSAYCDCGAYILEQHVISQNVLFNDEYIVRNICLKCGGLVDLGFVVMSSPQIAIIKTIGETSENDFLTSDGTILLDSSRDNYSNLNMPLEFELYEEKYTTIRRS